MSEDLITLIIYLALGLVGVIASAYKNKMKKQQSAGRPRPPEVSQSNSEDPEKDYGPELGPLMEMFDLPKPKQELMDYETIEYGPSEEEAGMAVEMQEASQELSGMLTDTNESVLDKQVSEVETFEEGQSDIQKMIAKYQAARKELEESGIEDEIASGEIVSVEAEEAARLKKEETWQYFEPRKAIIYSEILKRKEY